MTLNKRLSVVFFAIICASAHAQLGQITFVKGHLQALRKSDNQVYQELKKGDAAATGRLYQVGESSQAIMLLNHDTWLRFGKETKFELREEKGVVYVRLLDGTVRFLHGAPGKKLITQKLVFSTPAGRLQTTHSKGMVTHSAFFDRTSLYMDKGQAQFTNSAGQNSQTVTMGEWSEAAFKDKSPRAPASITEQEDHIMKKMWFEQVKEANQAAQAEG